MRGYRSSANTRSDERRKTLSLVTAVIMAVSCIACVIIKAVGKGNFSVHEILLYAAWALLAAESFLAGIFKREPHSKSFADFACGGGDRPCCRVVYNF